MAKQCSHQCGGTSAVPTSHRCVPRCPVGYTGLSCQRCAANFERVPQGPYLGTCSGCSCHGHSSTCDQVYGHCLVSMEMWGTAAWLWDSAAKPFAAPQNCQHNTEGPQCEKCKPGFFGDATQGTATACRPCPCPYTETVRRWVPRWAGPGATSWSCIAIPTSPSSRCRFSESCFLDTDGQATCDACAPGYAGRRCERWVCRTGTKHHLGANVPWLPPTTPRPPQVCPGV